VKLLPLLFLLTSCLQDDMLYVLSKAKQNANRDVCFSIYEPEEAKGYYCIKYKE
jgi:hypothetical protein